MPTPDNCEVAKYADDTALICESSKWNLKSLKKVLESGLATTEKYMNEWKIKINDSKTEFIAFSKTRKLQSRMKETSLAPVYNGKTFEWKSSVRYLGPILDTKLTFAEHVNTSLQKANAAISTLFCILRKQSKAYKSYIRPIFTFAGTVIFNSAKTRLKKLQVMQNKCLRMALNKPYYTRVTELHELAKIPTVEEFFRKNADKFYENVKHNDNPLISALGDYADEPLPFRLKHKLPRPL